jgi:hypothetical protein
MVYCGTETDIPPTHSPVPQSPSPPAEPLSVIMPKANTFPSEPDTAEMDNMMQPDMSLTALTLPPTPLIISLPAMAATADIMPTAPETVVIDNATQTEGPVATSYAPVYISQSTETQKLFETSDAPAYMSQSTETEELFVKSDAPVYVSQSTEMQEPIVTSDAPVYVSRSTETQVSIQSPVGSDNERHWETHRMTFVTGKGCRPYREGHSEPEVLQRQPNRVRKARYRKALNEARANFRGQILARVVPTSPSYLQGSFFEQPTVPIGEESKPEPESQALITPDFSENSPVTTPEPEGNHSYREESSEPELIQKQLRHVGKARRREATSKATSKSQAKSGVKSRARAHSPVAPASPTYSVVSPPSSSPAAVKEELKPEPRNRRFFSPDLSEDSSITMPKTKEDLPRRKRSPKPESNRGQTSRIQKARYRKTTSDSCAPVKPYGKYRLLVSPGLFEDAAMTLPDPMKEGIELEPTGQLAPVPWLEPWSGIERSPFNDCTVVFLPMNDPVWVPMSDCDDIRDSEPIPNSALVSYPSSPEVSPNSSPILGPFDGEDVDMDFGADLEDITLAISDYEIQDDPVPELVFESLPFSDDPPEDDPMLNPAYFPISHHRSLIPAVESGVAPKAAQQVDKTVEYAAEMAPLYEVGELPTFEDHPKVPEDFERRLAGGMAGTDQPAVDAEPRAPANPAVAPLVSPVPPTTASSLAPTAEEAPIDYRDRARVGRSDKTVPALPDKRFIIKNDEPTRPQCNIMRTVGNHAIEEKKVSPPRISTAVDVPEREESGLSKKRWSERGCPPQDEGAVRLLEERMNLAAATAKREFFADKDKERARLIEARNKAYLEKVARQNEEKKKNPKPVSCFSKLPLLQLL